MQTICRHSNGLFHQAEDNDNLKAGLVKTSAWPRREAEGTAKLCLEKKELVPCGSTLLRISTATWRGGLNSDGKNKIFSNTEIQEMCI